MRLFLLDRWPRLNVRFFDGSIHKDYEQQKIAWFRDRFFKYFRKIQDLVVGNSRLFIRVQYEEMIWHDWTVILRHKESSSQHKRPILPNQKIESQVEESKNPDEKKNSPRAQTLSSLNRGALHSLDDLIKYPIYNEDEVNN